MDPGGEAQLLLKVIQGDARAGEALWRDHAARVRLYALSLTRRESDADDILQSVFCSLLQLRTEQARSIASVRAWLIAGARHAVINLLRSTRRERRRRERWGTRTIPRITQTPVGAADSLRHALELLPRRDRELVVLRHVVGLTFDEMALAVGAKRSTAAERYDRAMEQLSGVLGVTGTRREGPERAEKEVSGV